MRSPSGVSLAGLVAPFVVLALCATALAAPAQRRAAQPPPTLPSLSMTCPMHPDIVESQAGACPVCKMNLVPVRLDSAWMCPVHSVVTESHSGTCRICGRDLIQVTVALTWACRGEGASDHLEPGLCGDGSPRIGRRTLRPHGNHNPQHGGQFFMAPDNSHHLEGTYPSKRVFRLYVYDDYARALPAQAMRNVRARVVTRETFDAKTRATTEVTAFPLRVSRNGGHLEARIDTTSLPAVMTAKVRLKPEGPEYRFDFTFPDVTKDPTPATTAARSTRAPRPAAPDQVPPTTATPVEPAPVSATPPADPDSNLVPPPIPETVPEILAQLRARNEQIGAYIAQGDFGSVWVPAFQAKDLAVALDPHLAHLTGAPRQAGEPALRNVVRTAWLLDSVGDLGNRQRIEETYSSFAAAVAQVLTAFAEAR